MLNNYQNPPSKGKRAAAMAAAKAAQTAASLVTEPTTEAELLACIEEYNRTELAVHELRRVIFQAVTRRSGYKMLRYGPDIFNGTPESLATMEHSEPARFIKVESLGSE